MNRSATEFCEVRTELHTLINNIRDAQSKFEIEVYKYISLLTGNEGNIFQIDEDTGNISMTKAADIVGPIILTVLVSYIEYLILAAYQMCSAKGLNL